MYSTDKSILQEIKAQRFVERNVRVFVKRDDLIDPYVSGNKWRKLKYIIEEAKHLKKDGVLTFGGAFSNHLLATAAACQNAGLSSIGIVRGEELTEESNENLKRCAHLGMKLQFITRSEYASSCGKECHEDWKQKNMSYLIVPEGGASFHGMVGCQEIWKEFSIPVDHLFVAQGTATTSAGLLAGIPNSETILHVVPAIKNFSAIETMRDLLFPFLIDSECISELLEHVNVHDSFHCGGYAKVTNELNQFMKDFEEEFEIPLDKIYTGKAMMAMLSWIASVEDFQGKNVVFLHTGGLMNGRLTIK